MATKDNWLKSDEVHVACDAIRLRGERVSTNAVYDELGQRGGFQTIQKHIKSWEALHAEEIGEIKNLPVVAEVPESIKEVANNLIKTFWMEAKIRAESDLDSQREAFKQAEQSMNLKIEDVATFSEQQSETIEVLRKEIAKIQGLLDEEESLKNNLDEKLLDKIKELREAETDRNIAHVEIKNLNKLVDEYNEFKLSANGEIKQLRAEIDELNKTHKETLETAKNKAFTEIKVLTEKLGKATATAELNSVEILKLKDIAQQNRALESQAQKLQFILDTSIIHLDEQKVETKAALEAEKAANRRADILEGELKAFRLQLKKEM